jgi:hypothetical protein
MTKKGISTVMVSAILVIVILVAAAIFINQQKQKTEKTFFGTLWSKFFPEKTEQIVIPGTTASSGCAPIAIVDSNDLARWTVTCFQKGEKGEKCCYEAQTSGLAVDLTDADWKAALKSIKFTEDTVWNLGSPRIVKGAPAPTLCYYDDYGPYNDVYLTFNPTADCS